MAAPGGLVPSITSLPRFCVKNPALVFPTVPQKLKKYFNFNELHYLFVMQVSLRELTVAYTFFAKRLIDRHE